VKQHLHVSIGPVQGFVAQSRRTRDLWGSSYLLSFLAAQAMSGARCKGGKIIRPQIDDDPMLQWVERRGQGEPPMLGSLPNQFTVEIEDIDPSAVATMAVQHFLKAWHQVCCAVWNKYIKHAASRGNGTEAIWKRQTEGFWEIVWIAGAPGDFGLLARRKHWRTHGLPEEAGNKCTMMPDLQELSGYVRATNRNPQDTFWNAIREKAPKLDLQEKERLCSIALIKRFYPRVSKEALGWEMDVTHWPSTVDVATVTWSRHVLKTCKQKGEEYAEEVLKASDDARTGGVSSLMSQAQSNFLKLDCNWFHRSFVTDPKQALLSSETTRHSLLCQLKELTDQADRAGPPIYFALLLADGDHLGQLLHSLGSETVSKALETFTKRVPSIVKQRYGITVYAGGDDVLALLPVEGALECAREIEEAYRKSFESTKATLSTAIVFAHARDPLNRILAEAHRLLDDVAKDQNGRNSLAACVCRGDATAIQWVTTWERSLSDGSRKHAVDCLRDVCNELRPNNGKLSGSLVHDLQHMLGLLCGSSPMAPGSFAKLGNGVELLPLVRGEIEHRLQHDSDTLTPKEDSKELATHIGNILARSRNAKIAPSEVGIDGLLLARFIAKGGYEEEHLP